MRVAIYDIETPYIDQWGSYGVNNIFCIAVKVVSEDSVEKTKIYTKHGELNADGNFKDALNAINSCDVRCGHNLVKFDDIVLTELGAVFTNKPFDTLLYSQVMYTKDQLLSMDYGVKDMPSNLYGKFSLKAFGYRLGKEQKIEFEQFDKLTEDMMIYCKRDVDVTYNLYKHIINSDRYPNDKLMKLEHDVAHILSYLERDGFYLDKEKARRLSLDLTLELQAIQRSFAKVFKPMFLPDGKPQKTNKLIKRKLFISATNYKDKWYYSDKHYHFKPYGKPHKKYKSGRLRPFGKRAFKWFTMPHNLVIQEKDGEFQNIVLTKFKATDQQIIKWFKHLYNYEFSTYTDKGNIRVDRDVLKGFADYLKLSVDKIPRLSSMSPEELETEFEAIEKLIRWKKILKDLSQLSGTDNSLLAKQREDGCVTTSINQNGTVTGRVSSCVPLDYKIATPNGPKLSTELKINDQVCAYNIETNKQVITSVKAVWLYQDKAVGTFTNGTINFTCTDNHKWLTTLGLLEAKDITKEHTLILTSNFKAKGFTFIENPNQQAVWCPTTKEQTWIAIHPETSEEFITGNSSINVNQIPSSKEFRGLFTAPIMYTIPDNLYYQLKEYL